MSTGRHTDGRRSNRVRNAQPVRPKDATAVMPQISRDAIPEAIEDDSRRVSAVTTRKPPKHRGARRFGIVIAVIAVIAIVAAAGAFISYQMGVWGDVEVPDVKGVEKKAAIAKLEEAGFEVEAHEEKVDTGYGTVTSMEPAGGTMQRHGSKVILNIGIERIVPEVIGLSPDAAQKLLAQEGAGGNIAVEYRVSVDADEDTVIAIEPEAGTPFKSTDPITLYVARSLKIPDVKGMQQDEAVAAIEGLGLTTQIEWRESDQMYQTVLETDPLPGTRVEEGSNVIIYIANGGPENRWHIIQYFETSSTTDAAYLNWQEWEFQFSDSSDWTIVEELWKLGNYDLFFGYEPWSFSMPDWYESSYETSGLEQGMSFNGVRMNFSDLSEGAVDERTVQRYMELCGFDNPQDTCTNEDISLPNKKKFDSQGISRVCTYGVTSGYTWVILLKGTNDGAVDVSLVAMDGNAVSRLTADGGSVCDMFMYRDAYPYGEKDEED